ncbi:hypothetical protein V2J09_017766 [Rumex salicifolius]
MVKILFGLRLIPIFIFIINPAFADDLDFEVGWSNFHGDYNPPPPLPPSFPPLPSLTCREDLKGFGTLDSLCELNHNLDLTSDVYIEGSGSLAIGPGVVISCPFSGCSITVNLGGEFSLASNATIIAGAFWGVASNASFLAGSMVNVSALGGAPPEHSSGTPVGVQGAGGGHGGRGANCLADNVRIAEDVWGGDAYAWKELDEPWSFGSKGGTTSKDKDYGGGGGGRIRLNVTDLIEVGGSLLADGGSGGLKGGGGSGGSIYIKANKMTGNGQLSASGGNGFAGGGGGRISINVFNKHDDQDILVHGGTSFGCLRNSGAAGTFYDAIPRRLIVCNHNMSTDTQTLLLEFPNQPLWTNVYIQNHAKATVPLLWSRVQVQGQLSLSGDSTLIFGLAHYPSSEFELMSEELLMSNSVIKVYGALRLTVKMHLMLNSKMFIDGDNDSIVATSLLEVSNLMVLKDSSIIRSTANLGVHGQGYLNLSGPGNLVEAQRLILSLFYSINVGSGSVLRGPVENGSINALTPHLYCEREDCPLELLHPPEDCNVNSSLVFTLQICRVEDVNIEGTVKGSVVQFHWVRSVVIPASGKIIASGLGCKGGVGQGMLLSNGHGGGGGHGGRGGKGYSSGAFVDGGVSYGNANLPCELGSGSGNTSLPGSTAGGGIIVMGSLEHSISSLFIDGSVNADGESSEKHFIRNHGISSMIGPGGGSGGSVLFFVQSVALGNFSSISAIGGSGSANGGGGGGGGRIHFHWLDIPAGDEYQPMVIGIADIKARGGMGRGQGRPGQEGTITGKECPKGLHGVFCEECPVGTFKNVTGSDEALCLSCPASELPDRAFYVQVRGGVTETPCPYKCISDRYHMPHCYTALEELVYTFGGPWFFGIFLVLLLTILALILSVARMKCAGGDELPGFLPPRRRTQLDHSFPFLESLNEVMETNRNEEGQSHVHRMYFMGPNTFSKPWHLPHSPPEQVIEIVYEDAFNRFVDEINAVASYQWWEGSVYSILSIVAYPLAWSWLQWRRRKKLQRLREFVRSEYDHACLRSCRSRALYEGLKLSATSDLMLAYMDFYLGGDEKRADLPPRLHQRLPMSLVFGGDGSYMAPFCFHNDNVLTSLMSQAIPPTVWYRFVAGLNAQLRLVCSRQLRMTFGPVMDWLETYANPTFRTHGVRVDLSWFRSTAFGYSQFGLVASVSEAGNSLKIVSVVGSLQPKHTSRISRSNQRDNMKEDEPLVVHKKISGTILHAKNLHVLNEKRNLCSIITFLMGNTTPLGHQDLIGLGLSVLLLGDFCLMLLMLVQLYSVSMLDFFLVLSILPLGVILPFPAGINALFSHEPRKSANLARIHALWNITSIINVMTAFICGFVHDRAQSDQNPQGSRNWTISRYESEWWLLPAGLFICKLVQVRLIDYHVANQEIQDHSLYSKDPEEFWQL